MVDTKEALEGQYLNAELVNNSPSKLMVVTSEGGYKETDYEGKKGRKLFLPVEIDKKAKEWRPNQDSIKNVGRIYGFDTKNWVGQPIKVRVVTIRGKDCVLAEPVAILPEKKEEAIV
jgi:hypothetical protein